MSQEAKVGLWGLLLIAIFMLLVPSISTRDSSLLGDHYDIVMDSAYRLREHNSVKIAGVTEGTINEIQFTTPEQRREFGEDAHVVLSIAMDANVAIPEDSCVSVNTSQSGDFWLEITPGVSKKCLHSGATVRLAPGVYTSAEPLSQEKLASVQNTIRGLYNLTGDPQFQRKIRDLASNARFYSEEVRLFSNNWPTTKRKFYATIDGYQASFDQQIERINVEISQGEKRLHSLRPQVHEKTAAFQERLKDGEKSIRGMLETAQRETQRLQTMSDKAAVLQKYNDPVYREKLHKIAKKLDNLAETTEGIHFMSKDPSVSEGLKELVKQYRTQSESIKERVQKFEEKVPEL